MLQQMKQDYEKLELQRRENNYNLIRSKPEEKIKLGE